MRVGVHSSVLGAQSLEDCFARAAKAGADGLELAYEDSGLASLLGQTDHTRKLQQLAEDCHVALPSFCLSLLCHEPGLRGDQPIIDRWHELIVNAMKTAQAVGAGVVLLPLFGKSAIETERDLQVTINNLQELVEPAEDLKVVLGIESALNFSQQEFLLGSVGHSPCIRVYYDTANALARKLDVATGIRQLGGEAIAQVHLKDVKIADGLPPDYKVPLGGGNVDFKAVIQALRAVQYDGWLIIEAPPLEGNPVDTARANLEWTRKLLAM